MKYSTISGVIGAIVIATPVFSAQCDPNACKVYREALETARTIARESNDKMRELLAENDATLVYEYETDDGNQLSKLSGFVLRADAWGCTHASKRAFEKEVEALRSCRSAPIFLSFLLRNPDAKVISLDFASTQAQCDSYFRHSRVSSPMSDAAQKLFDACNAGRGGAECQTLSEEPEETLDECP